MKEGGKVVRLVVDKKANGMDRDMWERPSRSEKGWQSECSTFTSVLAGAARFGRPAAGH